MIPRPIKISVYLLGIAVLAATLIGFTVRQADGYCDSCTKVPPFIGSNVDPDNICITNGGQEALLLALQAVASKGDVIAVESPSYHGLL